MTLAQEEERAVHDWKVGGSCPTIPFLPILSLSLGKALNPHSLLGMLGGGQRGCVVRIGSYALVSLAQGNCEHECRFNFLLQVFFLWEDFSCQHYMNGNWRLISQNNSMLWEFDVKITPVSFRNSIHFPTRVTRNQTFIWKYLTIAPHCLCIVAISGFKTWLWFPVLVIAMVSMAVSHGVTTSRWKPSFLPLTTHTPESQHRNKPSTRINTSSTPAARQLFSALCKVTSAASRLGPLSASALWHVSQHVHVHKGVPPPADSLFWLEVMDAFCHLVRATLSVAIVAPN